MIPWKWCPLLFWRGRDKRRTLLVVGSARLQRAPALGTRAWQNSRRSPRTQLLRNPTAPLIRSVFLVGSSPRQFPSVSFLVSLSRAVSCLKNKNVFPLPTKKCTLEWNEIVVFKVRLYQWFQHMFECLHCMERHGKGPVWCWVWLIWPWLQS